MSSHPHTVLLSGGIGSGKTRAAQAFAALGVPCLDTDSLARGMHQDPSHPATLALARAYPQAMSADGRLERGSLRSVFAMDPAANATLKRLFAPYMLDAVRAWSVNQQAPYVVVESALVQDLPAGFGRTLVIDAPDDIRRARIALRNPGWPAAQVDAVMSLQLPRAAYLARADDVIVNDGAPEALAALVGARHRHYLSLWSTT